MGSQGFHEFDERPFIDVRQLRAIQVAAVVIAFKSSVEFETARCLTRGDEANLLLVVDVGTGEEHLRPLFRRLQQIHSVGTEPLCR